MVTVNETLVREILDRLIRLEALAEGQNQRLDETNRRVDETNGRIGRLEDRVGRLEDRVEQMDARSTSRMDKLFYTMIGLGVAVIATLVAGQVVG